MVSSVASVLYKNLVVDVWLAHRFDRTRYGQNSSRVFAVGQFPVVVRIPFGNRVDKRDYLNFLVEQPSAVFWGTMS